MAGEPEQQFSNAKPRLNPLDGWLNVNKPSGITSHQAVARVKQLTGQRRVGHAGTLDPLACGVLPLALGKAARAIEFLHLVSKSYTAVIELGVETDTLDAEGAIIFRHDPSEVRRADVEAALKQFVGGIEQVPPLFSALKKDGRPLYELARRGVTLELTPRKVIIYTIKLVDFSSPLVTIDVECGSGTYIRSLARDLGQKLGVGGYLKTLCRTRYGPFDIKSSVAAGNLKSAVDIEAFLLPVNAGIGHLPVIILDEDTAGKVTNGVLPPELWSQFTDMTVYSLYRENGRLLGLIDTGLAGEYRLKVLEDVKSMPGSADS